jgi:hypothetical protein
VILASEKFAESEKSGQLIFNRNLFQKTRFCDQKKAFLVRNCTLARIFNQSAIFDQKMAHLLSQKSIF